MTAKSTARLIVIAVVFSAAVSCGPSSTPPPGAAEKIGSDARDSVGGSPKPLEFARIPAGTFVMGSHPSEVGSTPREQPAHSVTLTRDFWLSRHEVTVAQFAEFVDATGYLTEAEADPKGGWIFVRETGETVQDPDVDWKNPGHPQERDCPVVQVSWIDAEAFCRWRGKRDRRSYRLPTEAEWEYACRAGTKSAYSFGENPDRLRDYANVADASLAESFPAVDWSASWSDGYAFTAPVGQRKPNPWGLFDMHGNAWEWCADWHHDGYPGPDSREDPTGPSRADSLESPDARDAELREMRTIRGGGWYDPPKRSRSATRAWFHPVFRYCQLSGFRIAYR